VTLSAFLFAASTTKGIGWGLFLVLTIGLIVYAIVNARRSPNRPGSEIELAPNRKPYLTDEELEGPKLDRALTWGLILLGFIALFLPIYWLREPSRQAHALHGFDKRSIQRGAELFQPTAIPLPPGHIAAGCANCHGAQAQGGVVSFALTLPDGSIKNVQWQAPALNTVMLRYSPDEVKTILTYGRPPTPMPAWGVLGGGPLGDQQLNDLVNFLKSIQIPSTKAQTDPAQNSLLKSAKSLGTNGALLFQAYCARCHTLGWSYRQSYVEPTAKMGCGAYGPNLCAGTETRQFPDSAPGKADGVKAQTDFVCAGAEENKPYGRRGIGNYGMPGFCGMLTRDQVEAIVKYTRTL
jgi:mono/diheme cytochrome c family protein